MNRISPFLLAVLLTLVGGSARAQSAPQQTAVIGYYAGRINEIDSFSIEKLTHVIFSFCHLQGNIMHVDRAADTALIQKLVSLKSRNPRLKVMLSLGGWGGCKTCADVFATRKGRRQFAASVKDLTDYFHTDGIDLDWEYPALVNVPGYPFYPSDKPHFTALIRILRKKLGKTPEISFAAGGYTDYLKTSIEWSKVMPLVDRVNLMTYDLTNGYSTVTGHHTPLYSTPSQLESTDHAVNYLDSIGVPRSKMAIGTAFYGRIFENADSINNGLYRPTKFKNGVSYRNFEKALPADSGFVRHWDPVAQAPFMYNAAKKLFVTYDDSVSIRLKTKYAVDKQLNGVMFWQLGEDKFHDGLLDIIDETLKETGKGPGK
ncbi:MAG: glycosyl hydrolase family 18 protein [Puia sp.]|nr:glycosyl hydrolase family 18 protein [Puia sp.]